MRCPSCGRPHEENVPCFGSGEFPVPGPVPVREDEPTAFLVGRRREFAELVGGFEAALRGRAQLFLLVGDAGIGKTRLADELSALARERGALVLWGRCWEGGGAPSYWPWTEILRTYAREGDAETILKRMGAEAAPLAQLVPELVDAEEWARPVEGDAARFLLFDTTATFLRHATAEHPVVLVLDDLHSADPASLLLLEFVARALRGSRLLVVGSYREGEARRHASVAQLLGALAREGRHLVLRGLGREDVAAFVTRVLGRPPGEPLVDALHEITEGNPFFLEEVVRLLVADDQLELLADHAAPSLVRIPDGIRGTIRHRVDPLREETVWVLSTAAVIGREFDLALLQPVCRMETEALLDALGDAVDAAIVAEVPERPGRFAFSHTLIRETLYGDLSPAHRVRLHRKVGEVLEAVYEGNTDAVLAVLAHHFFHAATSTDVGKAVEYSLRAANSATRMLAYEQAVAHCQLALQAVERVPSEPLLRCDVLLALAEALLRAGDAARGRRTFEEAAELARRLGSPAHLARAALGVGGLRPTPLTGTVDVALVALLEEARTVLGEEDSRLRVRVLARLAMELYYTATFEERDALTQEALDVAARLDEPAPLAVALNARHYAMWGREPPEERVHAATRILELATAGGDLSLAMQGHAWRMCAFLELGDVAAADAEMARHRRLADQLRQGPHLWEARVFAAMRALLDGRFDAAEALSEEAAAIGITERDQPSLVAAPDAASARLARGVQRFSLLRELGRVGELEDDVRTLAAQQPQLPVWRCALALVYCEAGRLDEARREFERLAVDRFSAIARDGNWLPAMVTLADVCAALGDAGRAAELYDLLAPEERHHVVAGQAFVYRGAVVHALARLAATAGDVDTATKHFETALETYQRMGARPFLARAAAEYAAAIAGPDPALAAELRARARELARSLGLDAPAGERDAGPAGAPRPVAAPAAATAPGGDGIVARLSREGEYWTIAAGGAVVRLKDSKGLRYVATLLERPDQEVHVFDLIAAVQGTGNGAVTGERHEQGLIEGFGDAGAVLDAQARQSYRRHLEALRQELAEAELHSDAERASRLSAEIEFVQHELAAGVGLGGRERRAASAAERARVSVTKAIKSAVRKIQENQPDVGRHLDLSVRTGMFCSYVPDARVPVTWTR